MLSLLLSTFKPQKTRKPSQVKGKMTEGKRSVKKKTTLRVVGLVNTAYLCTKNEIKEQWNVVFNEL